MKLILGSVFPFVCAGFLSVLAGLCEVFNFPPENLPHYNSQNAYICARIT
jgi:hypothetical protein